MVLACAMTIKILAHAMAILTLDLAMAITGPFYEKIFIMSSLQSFT
jgi:hypothetical protein